MADRFTREGIAEKVAAAVAAGIAWVHLRDHAVSPAVFAVHGRALVERLRALNPNLWISINTHMQLAHALGVGLHLGWRGPSVAEARKHMRAHVLGYSAHTREAARQAVTDGAAYLFFSPIFATMSKPTAAPVGLAALEQACRAVPHTPVYALGGITPERLPDCVAHGAYGCAILSGILAVPDPATAVRSYQAALARAIHHHNS